MLLRKQYLLCFTCKLLLESCLKHVWRRSCDEKNLLSDASLCLTEGFARLTMRHHSRDDDTCAISYPPVSYPDLLFSVPKSLFLTYIFNIKQDEAKYNTWPGESLAAVLRVLVPILSTFPCLDHFYLQVSSASINPSHYNIRFHLTLDYYYLQWLNFLSRDNGIWEERSTKYWYDG